MSPTSRRGLADEVTRVSAVSYLQGATGHGVGSLAFLLVGVVGFAVTDSPAVGFGGVASACLMSGNGLSLYLWDRVRDAAVAGDSAASDRGRRDDDSGGADGSGDAVDRTLSPPSLSAEHRAELASGLVQVVGLVVVLAAVFFVFRRLGVTYGSYLLGGVLAVGNLAALALAWRRTDG
ncbi:hypothetical protein [Halobellus rubicundus]|uniref:Uncharacterized protein n=1 Tax=Halobellus rubicundus TaxID=2996466 RepID=A0ABD5MAD2_9EURY